MTRRDQSRRARLRLSVPASRVTMAGQRRVLFMSFILVVGWSVVKWEVGGGDAQPRHGSCKRPGLSAVLAGRAAA